LSNWIADFTPDIVEVAKLSKELRWPMTKVIVTEQTREALNGLGKPLVFCDEDGKTIGYFQPSVNPPFDLFDLGISNEEMRRRDRETTGRTLNEILADWDRAP
jgi:hypothetical protein